MLTQQKKQLQMAAFVLITFAAVVGLQQSFSFGQGPQDRELGPPLPVTRVAAPDAAKAGNVPAAMEQSPRLMTLLKANNWSSGGIPMNVLQLPDRRFAEEQVYNRTDELSYVIPFLAPAPQSTSTYTNDPKEDDLAFYTSIYARRNTVYYKGEQVRHHPSGFYIVGLKNGRVFQVPVGDVRQVRGVTKHIVTLFPGMKAYDPNAWRLPEVEFASGAPPKERMAAWEKEMVDDCPTCPQ